jgi:hypothetical protein
MNTEQTQDRTNRARTQADRWTEYVAQVTAVEAVQIFAESRAARLYVQGQSSAVLYRDGSATLAFPGGAVAVNPLFSAEAELIREQRDRAERPWIGDLFELLEGRQVPYQGEARTAFAGYTEELQALAAEVQAAVGQMEPPPPPSDEEDELEAADEFADLPADSEQEEEPAAPEPAAAANSTKSSKGSKRK